MKGLRRKYIAFLLILRWVFLPPSVYFNPDKSQLSCVACSVGKWESSSVPWPAFQRLYNYKKVILYKVVLHSTLKGMYGEAKSAFA